MNDEFNNMILKDLLRSYDLDIGISKETLLIIYNLMCEIDFCDWYNHIKKVNKTLKTEVDRGDI